MPLNRFLPLLFAILIYLSFFMIQVWAQDTTNYSQQTFDLSIDRLPQQYIGHDPEAVANSLDKLVKASKKSEFETTTEFNARIHKQKSLPILGDITIDNLFAFSSADTQVTYDADHQILDIMISKLVFRPVPGIGTGRNTLEIPAKIISYPDKHYEGVNAFGVRANITERTHKIFQIAVNNYRDLPSKSENLSYGTRISYAAKLKNITVPLAINVKENTRLLIICKIVEPFTSSDVTTYDATISNPLKLVQQNHFIFTQVAELWFYNLASGEIFAKLRQASQTPSKKGTSRQRGSK